MKAIQRPGGWAPVLAITLALALGAALFSWLSARSAEQLNIWRLERSVEALLQSPKLSEELRQAGIQSWLLRPEQRGGWSFPRQLTPLSQAETPAPRALQNIALGASAKPQVRLQDEIYMAAQEHEGRIALAQLPSLPVVPLPWLHLLLAALLGLLLWQALIRWRSSPWVGPLGALLSGALLSGALFVGGLEVEAQRAAILESLAWLQAAPPAQIPLSWASAAMALPLLLFGLAAAFTQSRCSEHRLAYLYVTPALLGMGLLILIPFAFGFGLAFFRYGSGPAEFVGLRHFIDILSSEGFALTHPLSFYYTLFITILWTLLNVSFHIGLGLGLALILKEPTLRLKGLYRVLLILPWAVPNYITALIWKGMFNAEYGLINHLLGLFKIEGIAWFSETVTAFTANLATNTWLGFPFMMVITLGALQSIPKDLYEAADVDGASNWQKFKWITVPLLKPALIPALILGSIWTFNMFNIIYLVSQGQPNNSTDILIVEAYRVAFEQERYGYAAAYSVLIFLILLIYSRVTERISRAAEGAYG